MGLHIESMDRKETFDIGYAKYALLRKEIITCYDYTLGAVFDLFLKNTPWYAQMNENRSSDSSFPKLLFLETHEDMENILKDNLPAILYDFVFHDINNGELSSEECRQLLNLFGQCRIGYLTIDESVKEELDQLIMILRYSADNNKDLLYM